MWWNYHLLVYVLHLLADRHVEGLYEEDQRCRLTLCLSEEDQRDVNYLVKKRHFDDKGEYSSYIVAKAHWSQEQDGEKKRVNTAHVRRKRNVDAVTHLHLETDEDHFDLELQHIYPVLTEGAAVVQRWGDVTWLWREDYPRDCYMTGHMANNMSNTVSLSYCTHLMGSFKDGSKRYWIEFISNNHTDDSSTEHVVLALQQKSSDPDLDPIDDVVFEPLPAMEGQQATSAASGEKIVIEMFFMFDSWWLEWSAKLGYVSQAEQLEFVLMLLNVVALEYSKDVLNYDITFHVKKMEFWKKNADWYVVKVGANTMQWTLDSVCDNTRDMNPRYDLVHMVTGHPDRASVFGNKRGMAVTNGACYTRNCGVSHIEFAGEAIVLLHEIGHNLGMVHIDIRAQEGCEFNGIMDYQGKMASGWSPCSIADLHTFLSHSRSRCLREENVKLPLHVELVEAYIGMKYDDDTICRLRIGPEYIRDQQMRPLVGICQMPWLCVHVDHTSETMFGFTKRLKVQPGGEYCGDGKICSKLRKNEKKPDEEDKFSCDTFEELGLNPNHVAVIAGAWGNWGPLSTKCTRTCGTGVKIRVRKCDNPRSQKAPQCKGSKYEATLCGPEPCPDETDMTTLELIEKRGKDVCTIRKNQDEIPYPLYRKEFTEVGNPMEKPYDCKLRCANSNLVGRRKSWEFDGYFAHGTPCDWDSSGYKPSFADRHGLITRSRLSPRCLMGVCQLFGCDGELGKTKFDACGVCGGSNSTCHLYTGTFTESLEGGQRESIFNFTGDSDFIDFQVYYDGTEMEGYHVELWTADDEPIISLDTETKIEPTSKDAPITFGGAEWHYSLNAGYIYSEGPFNMNATIKLYCNTTGENNGVHYSYIVPIASLAPGTGCPNLITMLLTVGVWCWRWQR